MPVTLENYDQLRGGGHDTANYYNLQRDQDPANYTPPDGYEILTRGDQSHVKQTPSWLEKHQDQLALGAIAGIGTAGVLGGLASGAYSGGAAAAGGAGAGAAGAETAATAIPSLGVTPWAASSIAPLASAGTGAAAATAAGASSGMSPLLWAALINGGTSLAGAALGNDDAGVRQPYTGATTNPETTLSQLMSAIGGTGDAMRSQYGQGVNINVPRPYDTTPVQVPGLPFQIGGSINADPAMRNFTLPGMQFPQIAGGGAAGAGGSAVPRAQAPGGGHTRQRRPTQQRSEN